MSLAPEGDYAGTIADQQFDIREPGRVPTWGIVCWLRARRGPDGRAAPCPAFRRAVRFPFPGGDLAALLDGLDTLGVGPDDISLSSPTFTRLAGQAVVLRCDHRVVGGKAEEAWTLVSAGPPPAPASQAAAPVPPAA